MSVQSMNGFKPEDMEMPKSDEDIIFEEWVAGGRLDNDTKEWLGANGYNVETQS